MTKSEALQQIAGQEHKIVMLKGEVNRLDNELVIVKSDYDDLIKKQKECEKLAIDLHNDNSRLYKRVELLQNEMTDYEANLKELDSIRKVLKRGANRNERYHAMAHNLGDYIKYISVVASKDEQLHGATGVIDVIEVLNDLKSILLGEGSPNLASSAEWINAKARIRNVKITVNDFFSPPAEDVEEPSPICEDTPEQQPTEEHSKYVSFEEDIFHDDIDLSKNPFKHKTTF